MTKEGTLSQVICADHFFMSDTAMSTLERIGQVIWADCPSEEAFIQLIHEIQPEVIISEYVRISSQVMDASSTLKGIVGWGVGYDHIDVEAASKRGIYVANTRGSNAESVAEHVFALLLCLSRNILQTEHFVRAGNWISREEAELPSDLVAQDLYKKTIGIIGLGAIGSRVARIAHGFNMRVMAYDPYISTNTAQESEVELSDLETLLKESDIITLHVPLTSETRGMISTREFNLMKPTTYLMNTSRGQVIDEEALISALKEKKLTGAGLDVFTKEPIELDNQLLTLNNVILSPHCAGNSNEALEATSNMVADEAVRILKGEVPINLVNRSQLVKNGFL